MFIIVLAVGSTIKDLEKRFSSLQSRLSSELSSKETVTTDSLLDSLTQLPIALRNEYRSIIKENLHTLQNMDSIRKIFHHLNFHFTFIDYHLLNHLIEIHGSSRLKGEMSQYIDDVERFFDQTTVEQLIDIWPGEREASPHMKELIALIDEDPSTYTLRRLNDLRKKLCNVVKLSETVLTFIGVGRKSSFILSLMIPSILLPEVKSVISSLSIFYQKEHIISIIVDKKTLFSIVVSHDLNLSLKLVDLYILYLTCFVCIIIL